MPIFAWLRSVSLHALTNTIHVDANENALICFRQDELQISSFTQASRWVTKFYLTMQVFWLFSRKFQIKLVASSRRIWMFYRKVCGDDSHKLLSKTSPLINNIQTNSRKSKDDSRSDIFSILFAAFVCRRGNNARWCIAHSRCLNIYHRLPAKAVPILLRSRKILRRTHRP